VGEGGYAQQERAPSHPNQLSHMCRQYSVPQRYSGRNLWGWETGTKFMHLLSHSANVYMHKLDEKGATGPTMTTMMQGLVIRRVSVEE
jgi:hypothetical protein